MMRDPSATTTTTTAAAAAVTTTTTTTTIANATIRRGRRRGRRKELDHHWLWFVFTLTNASIHRSIAVLVAFVFVIEVLVYQRLQLTHTESLSQSQSQSGAWESSPSSPAAMQLQLQLQLQQKGRQQRGPLRLFPSVGTGGTDSTSNSNSNSAKIPLPGHLLPAVPVLPLFDSVPDAEDRVRDVLAGKPSVAGIVAILQNFLAALHERNDRRIATSGDGHVALDDFYRTAEEHLKPLEERYRGRHVFPVRSDGSVFVSVAAFREQLLADTLVSAFKHAKHPEKLFVGAVVQNCFGTVLANGTIDPSGTPCLTGPLEVPVPVPVDPPPNGHNQKQKQKQKKPRRRKIPAPPDANGVAVFCGLPDYRHYCDRGQVRVLYVHETDSLGPSMARYYASRLWGGENYFVQIDSHLHFADHWDAKYVTELKATRTYPRSVLSSYPPGFEQVKFIPKHMNIDRSTITNETVVESPGCRLCGCSTPLGESNPIIHIKQGFSYRGDEPLPTQTPYLGAGMIVAHADFLREVPFDPYLPWTFMGEEILLSMRTWTHGWNIYAPRKNWIIHQYRTGIAGIPKFTGAVNSGARQGFKTAWLQKGPMRRIKHLCGYPNQTSREIEADGQGFVLVDKEHYGLGSERSWNDYLQFSELTVNHTTGLLDCRSVAWCNKGLKT